MLLIYAFVVSFFLCSHSTQQVENIRSDSSFVIDHKRNVFLANGRPYQIFSGGVHYFRVTPDKWERVMRHAKASGLNTIETYVPWSLHEPKEGEYNFKGRLDLFKFLGMARANELLVILRVGPYSCAELDQGGIPPWLSKYTKTFRISKKSYMDHVLKWLRFLLPQIRSHLFSKRGSIIMVQVENEYGGLRYYSDPEYMLKMERIFRFHLEYDVILFITDQCTEETRANTTLFRTTNFGPHTDIRKCYKRWRMFQKTGPFMNMEFYAGWFSSYGNQRMVVDSFLVVNKLKQMVQQGHSFNIYVYMGGTNFDYMNAKYITTSYEYDGILDEASNSKFKGELLRDMLMQYTPLKQRIEFPPVPKDVTFYTKDSIAITNYAPTVKVLDFIRTSKGSNSTSAQMFESYDHYGFLMLYQSIDSLQGVLLPLHFSKISDVAVVSVNEEYVGTYRKPSECTHGRLTKGYGKVNILVANEGRRHIGNWYETKGIEKVYDRIGKEIFGWQVYPISIQENIRDLQDFVKTQPLTGQFPGFYFTSFHLFNSEVLDTYLYLKGFSAGSIFVNGYNIGRYRLNLRPQQTLYVPSSFLIWGTNNILIHELEGTSCSEDLRRSKCFIKFVSQPLWI